MGKRRRAKPDVYRDYFLPGEGIKREVILHEICRYLGDDALVMPYQHTDGQKGYLITAYRAPTTQMIMSLKEDSIQYERQGGIRGEPFSFKQNLDSDRARSSIRHTSTSNPYRPTRLDIDPAPISPNLPPEYSRPLERDVRMNPDRPYRAVPVFQPYQPTGNIYHDLPGFLSDTDRELPPSPKIHDFQTDQSTMVQNFPEREPTSHSTGGSSDYSLQRELLRRREILQRAEQYIADRATTWLEKQQSVTGRQNPFWRSGKLFDLPLIIEGRAIVTIPDTGAQINAISKQTMKMIKAQGQGQWGGDGDKVGLGNGTTGEAICQWQLWCRFPDDTRNIKLTFHVFSALADGVSAIMGHQFLEATQCLTKHSSRLRERRPPSIPRCLSLGPLQPSGLLFKVFLNAKVNRGLADTGSEIDLISQNCATRNGFQVLGLEKADRSLVQLATGGPPIRLSSKVVVRFDAFKEADPPLSLHSSQRVPSHCDQSSKQREDYQDQVSTTYTQEHVDTERPPNHDVTFYILPDLPYDLIFSQSLLYAMDAFNLHKDAFEQATLSSGQTAALCPYFWYNGTKYKAEHTVSDCDQKEVNRRAKFRSEHRVLEDQIQRAQSHRDREESEYKLRRIRREDEEGRRMYEAERAALREAEAEAPRAPTPPRRRWGR